MAGARDPGEAVDAIITLLSNNLAAQFNTIDGEWNDNITLNDVAAYYRAGLTQYSAYPVVLVEPLRTQMPDRLRNYAIQFHEIQIGFLERAREQITHSGRTLQPPEVALIRVERSLDAIQRVIEANDHLPVSGVDKADKAYVTEIAYFEMVSEGARAQNFGQGGILRLRVHISP